MSSQRVGTVEEMPASFEGKLLLLEDIIQSSVEKLLNEAKRRNCLKPPYGKTPYPTPLITEEEFFRSGAWKEDLDENNEPTFNYSYGFNPLRFMGDMIQWAHPKSVVARLDAKKQAFNRLSSIGRHALRRLETWADLRQTVSERMSGMLWGPVTGAISSSTVTVLCQPLRSGVVSLHTSFDENFSNIIQTVTVDFKVSDTGDDYVRNFSPCKLQLSELVPGTKYYIRCCLGDFSSSGAKEARFFGVDSACFSAASFWTLPSDVIPPLSQEEQERLASHDDHSQALEVKYDPLSIWLLNGHSLKSNNNSLMEAQWAGVSDARSVPQTTCILGDIISSAQSKNSLYRDNIFDINVKSNHSASQQSILKCTSVLLAWNDTRLGSDVDLRSEEVAYKQYRHDLKKFEKQAGLDKKSGKKPNIAAMENAPVRVRPGITDSLLSVMDTFPLPLDESGATRSLNRVVALGPDIQLFILDSRSGYLGKSQAKWLRDELEGSHALWKLVLSGVPLGLKVMELQPKAPERPRSTSFSPQGENDANLGEGEFKAAEVIAVRRDRSVSVLLPNAVDHDDMDECGVPKSSLQYVITSIQKRIDSKNKVDGGSLDENEEVSSQVSSKDKLLSVASSDELNVLQSASTVLPILLESGIVFFSSGGLAPFVATYDPVNWGRPFLAEVHIGGMLNRDVVEQEYPNLTPQISFRGVASDATSCNVTLMQDGALKVSILEGANLANESIFRIEQKH